MNIFDLAAVLTLDKKDYDKGLADAEGSASSFSSKLGTAAKVGAASVAAIGAAAVGAGAALVNATGEVSKHGDEIDKMSQKLGLSAEGYQKWDYVLSQSGADINSMQVGLKTLTNKLDEAKNGSAGAQEMFSKLGLKMSDLKNMSREEVFEATIKGFQGMADSTERAALANDLFGKSGQNLTPLFNESAESTEQLMQAAEDLGMVMSDDAVKSAAAYGDSLDTLQRTMGGLKNKLVGEFMPGITGVMDGLTAIFSGNSDEGIGKISEGISSVIGKLTEMMPQILELGSSIVLSLGEAIVQNLPSLMSTAVKVITELATGIIQNLPMILETGINVILALVQGLTEALPQLIPAVVEVIMELAQLLTDPTMLAQLIEAAVQIIMALADGLIQALPILIAEAPTIIANLVQALTMLLPEILAMGIQLIVHLVGGIIQAVPEVGKGIAAFFSEFGAKIKERFAKVKQWGKDLIANFISGIKAKFQDIKNAFSSIGKMIKSLIGFSEPEEGPLSNFHTFAPDMIDLFTEGVEKGKSRLQEAVGDAFDFSEATTPPSFKAQYSGATGTETAYSQIADDLQDMKRMLAAFFRNTNNGANFSTSTHITNTREMIRLNG